MDIAVVGAGGYLGTLVTGALAQDGAAFRAVSRPWQPDEVAARHDTVIATLPPGRERNQLRAAVADVGGAYLDAAIQPESREEVERMDRRARERGASLVLGAGWRSGLGDLLASRAASALDAAIEVFVTYHVPGRVSVLRRASPGERAELLGSVLGSAVVLDHGEDREVRAAELRRLAWFPRPVGPHHAAVVAGREPLSVPLHVPEVKTVRAQVAVRSWLAELVQGAGHAARLDSVRRRIQRRQNRDRPGPSEQARADERWAVVAEAADRDGKVARAWAYGHDRHGLTARLLVELAGRVRHARAAGHGAAGVLAAAQVADSREVLDALSVATDLRWSVSRPQ